MAYPAVSFLPKSPYAGLQPINDVSSTAKHPLGMTISASDVTYGEGTFIYLEGIANTAAGDLVTYDSKLSVTTRAFKTGITSTLGPCAIAMAAIGANQYGWYQITGSGPVNSGTVLADTLAYITSTAGQIDDAIAADSLINGMVIKAADSGGFCTVQIDRPCIIGGDSGTNTGDVTLAGIGSSPNNNGMSITGQTLSLQPADGANPGALTATNQAIGGNKTFNGTASFFDASPTSTATGPGISLVYSGRLTRGQVKITIDKTAWTASATTQDITIVTIPARTRIVAAYSETTEAYAGLVGTIEVSMGSSAGGTQILGNHDVKTATVTKGLLDADMGASMTRAAQIQGGYLPSFTGTTNISVRLTSGVGNIGNAGVSNLTNGSTTYYLLLETL